MIDKIRIVLVETSHPGNIGSVARAMYNMGLVELYLVNPKVTPNGDTYALASGAKCIIDNCLIVKTLDEALIGVNFIVGTSARQRKFSIPLKSIKDMAPEVLNYSTSGSKCAIVFGRERTGLYNSELLKCHLHTYIPANPDYSSLNLSQAVQVISYEIRRSYFDDIPNEFKSVNLPASSEKCSALYEHIEEMLCAISFIKEEQPGYIIERLKRMFQRARLEDLEVNILRGICKQIINGLKNP